MGISLWNFLNAELRCLDYMLWQWGAIDCVQIVM